MDSHNIGKQCFPIVSEKYVVRTFSRQSFSNLFLQRKPCFRTFPRNLSCSSLVHHCTLCSASKYRQSFDTCKTSNVEVSHPCPLFLLLCNVASPFLVGKNACFPIFDFGKIHGMKTSLFPFLERCTTFVQYSSDRR